MLASHDSSICQEPGENGTVKGEEMQERGLKLVYVVDERTAIRQTAMRPLAPRTFASSLSFVTGAARGRGSYPDKSHTARKWG